MKKIVLGIWIAWMAAPGWAGDGKPFYAGVSGGLAMPMDMLEEWSWEERGQSADLKEELKNGLLAGVKAGYVPPALGGFFAAEVEYSYQRAEFDKIMSPGFAAGPHAISGFYSPATDSHVEFQSLFLNLLVRYPDGKVHPYAGIGPGVTRCSVSFNEANLTTEGFGFAETGDDTAFCWQAVAGVDFDVAERVVVGAGYRYFAAEPSFTWANGTQSDYDPITHNVVLDVKCRF
ncbi:MAG: porin family protein [Opitutae bacterium]|nr:porin family protein [Opitutae bacterium]